MSRIDTYYPGGFVAASPAQNRQSRADSATGYTEWSPAGAITLQRALSPAETQALADSDAATAQSSNLTTLVSRASTALNANAAFLALGSPTNAQVLAQTQLLTKECNALIRLAVGLFDSTAGT